MAHVSGQTRSLGCPAVEAGVRGLTGGETAAIWRNTVLFFSCTVPAGASLASPVNSRDRRLAGAWPGPDSRRPCRCDRRATAFRESGERVGGESRWCRSTYTNGRQRVDHLSAGWLSRRESPWREWRDISLDRWYRVIRGPRWAALRYPAVDPVRPSWNTMRHAAGFERDVCSGGVSRHVSLGVPLRTPVGRGRQGRDPERQASRGERACGCRTLPARGAGRQLVWSRVTSNAALVAEAAREIPQNHQPAVSGGIGPAGDLMGRSDRQTGSAREAPCLTRVRAMCAGENERTNGRTELRSTGARLEHRRHPARPVARPRGAAGRRRAGYRARHG